MRAVEEPTSFFRRQKKTLVRAVFAMAALLWMVFVIVFLTMGLNGLNGAKAAFEESSTVSQLRNAIFRVPFVDDITDSLIRHSFQHIQYVM